MNEYSPVDAANSHWRRRTRPPASRLAPTTRVSPLLHSFFLPSSYHLRRLYQLRSSIFLARIPLSLSLYFFLSIPLPSFRPLPPRCHISYIHPSFFIRLFFSRVRLSRSFSVARAPPRMRASSSHQRSRMMIDANVREASHVRTRAQRRGRSFIRSVRSFMPRPHVSTV